MRSIIPAALLLVLTLASCKQDDVIVDPPPVTIAQERYALPGDTLFPEGIAYRAAHFYTGSVTSGDIYKVNVETGSVTQFAAGSAQQRAAATGMRFDNGGRLWVCGGASATVTVLGTEGQLLKRWDLGSLFGAQFVNDVTALGNYMYFTDSRAQKIYRASLNEALDNMEAWLSFGDAQIPYVAGGTNANGIVATPDDRSLLVVVSTSGKLYRIDIESKAIREVALSETITAGDGLLLEGRQLYVCRNATNKIYPVSLNSDYTKGTVGTPFGDGLLFNTTMARAGSYLLVVNGQLNQRATQTPVLPFSVSRVSLP